MTALLALASAVLIGGADFLGGLTSRRANGIRVAALRDPYGNQFGLIDNPHFDPAKVR